MLPTRSVALFAIALSLLSIAATTRAGTVVFNNLDQPPQPTASSPFVGQSFIAGTQDYELYGARMQLDLNNPPTTNIQLEVEARNANGTVGQTLFDNFSSSFNSGSGIVTFIANAPFLFTANTGYWLVLSDPTKGNVTWLFTASQFYESNDGYGLPSYNTSYYFERRQREGDLHLLSAIRRPADVPAHHGSPGTVLLRASRLRRGNRRRGDVCAVQPSVPVPAVASRTGLGEGAAIDALRCQSTLALDWSGFDRGALRGESPRTCPLSLGMPGRRGPALTRWESNRHGGYRRRNLTPRGLPPGLSHWLIEPLRNGDTGLELVTSCVSSALRPCHFFDLSTTTKSRGSARKAAGLTSALACRVRRAAKNGARRTRTCVPSIGAIRKDARPCLASRSASSGAAPELRTDGAPQSTESAHSAHS